MKSVENKENPNAICVRLGKDIIDKLNELNNALNENFPNADEYSEAIQNAIMAVEVHIRMQIIWHLI